MLILFFALCVIFLSIFYIYKRTIVRFFDSKLYRILGFIFVFSCAFSMLIGVMLTRYYTGSLLPARIVSVIAATYLFFVFFSLLKDFTYYCLRLIEIRVETEIDINKVLYANFFQIILIIFSFSLSCTGLYYATIVPDVKNVEISYKNLPESLDGFTITQITDLHAGTGSDGAWLKKVVAKVNELEADIIVLTGDIVDNTPEVLGEDMEALADLKAPYGEYFILGNHEYHTELNPWIEYFEDLGNPLLVNETKLIEYGNATMTITGLADLAGNRKEFIEQGYGVDHEKALSYIPEEIYNSPNNFRLLLMHQPKGAQFNAQYGYDLQLSGHTHGGQVFLLFPLVEAANDGYRLGTYIVENMILYVSSGTSHWGYWSMRLGAPTEITYITLKKG